MPAVEIYRAVKDPELTDLTTSGRFNPSPYGSEIKYFSVSMKDASSYAKMAFGTYRREGPYTAVSTDIDDNILLGSDTGIVDFSVNSIMILNENLGNLSNIDVKAHMEL